MSSGQGARLPRPAVDVGRLLKVATLLYLSAVVALLVLPGLILIPISLTSASYLSFPPPSYSLTWYYDVFRDPAWRSALANSLIISVGATVVALAAGVPAALTLRRLRLPVIEAAAVIPLITPGIVIGVGLYRWYLPNGWIGSQLGIVFPEAVLGLPFVVVTVLATLRRVDPELDRAARTLGAPQWRALATITLPLAWAGIAAGAFFAFISAFDEVVIPYFLASSDMTTVPRLLYEQTTQVVSPTLAVVSTLLVGVSATGLGIGGLLLRKAIG